MHPFFTLLALAAIIYFVWVIARRVMGGGGGGGFGRPKLKCATCRSCGKLFEDGALCRFQGRETFKNETHIANCIDYQPK